MAIEETTNQALCTEYQCVWPLSGLIQRSIDTANTRNLQLYRTSVHIRGRETVFKRLSLEITPLLAFLPQFPLIIPHKLDISAHLCTQSIIQVPKSLEIEPLLPQTAIFPAIKPVKSFQSSLPRISNIEEKAAILFNSLPGSKKPFEEEGKREELKGSKGKYGGGVLGGEGKRIERAVLGRTSCIVCQSYYKKQDYAYFCPEACMCRLCVIERIAGKANKCEFCNKIYSQDVISLVNTRNKRCHVCEIVLDISDMETSSLCDICQRCVITLTGFLGLQKAKGKCRFHSDNKFEIVGAYYEDLKEVVNCCEWACCASATSADRQLLCGHYVCGVHQGHLKYCRTCQTPVASR